MGAVRTSSTPEFGVITEDDDNVNVNWPSLLEALIHALTKEKKTEPQKHSYSANLTIRIDYESDRELDGEDLNDLVGNLAIKTVSKTKGVEIISTEICGLND